MSTSPVLHAPKRGVPFKLYIVAEEKIKGVQAPTCKKDLQKFLGKVYYLRRFIANLSGKIIPFTPILRLKDEFEFTWGAKQQETF